MNFQIFNMGDIIDTPEDTKGNENEKSKIKN